MTASKRGKKPILVRLTEADLPAVAALEAAHGWPVGGSEAQWKTALADPATAVYGLMAGDAPTGDELLGYAAVARLPFEAELQTILVDEARRGQGLARQLLTVVADQARDWRSERLLLEVRAGNAPAIALYRAVGFREDGIRRGYYPPLPSRASPSLHAQDTPPPRQAGAVKEDALLMSLALG